MKKHLWFQYGWLALIFLGFSSQAHAQVDFVQVYGRGKVLLQNKLYLDAVREFTTAIQTDRGRRHFGAHFYLATAFYWLPDIQQAMQVLQVAKQLATRPAHRNAHRGLLKKIQTLYSHIKLTPEIDPEEVGRLYLKLQPRHQFSHPHKQRYYRILAKQLGEQGILLNNNPIYIPKGDYIFHVASPQCLMYGIFGNNNLVQQITIDDNPHQLTVKAQRSCNCEGGQKMVKKGGKLLCECPSGTGWNKKKRRCEVGGSSALPWILVGTGVIVAGAVTAIVILNLPDGTGYKLLNGPGGNSVRLWQLRSSPKKQPISLPQHRLANPPR